MYIGSLEKGAGSRRLTEGFFRVTSYIKQKIPQNHSTRSAGSPSLKGRLINIGLPFRGAVTAGD